MADLIEKSAILIIGVPCRTHFEYLASRAVTIELPEDRSTDPYAWLRLNIGYFKGSNPG